MSYTSSYWIKNKVFVKDFKELTKLGLSLSVLFSAVTGYLLAVDKIDYSVFFSLIFGGYFTVSASNIFNQIIEKDSDKLMQRTMNRPLPTERYSVDFAMAIAIVFGILGLIILYNINENSFFFGAISIFLYTCLYTPLKKITPFAVFFGAFPGAIPFMLGWIAATDNLGIESGLLFLIQFFWQFPHFWSIGWIEYEEYFKAGYNLLPSGKKDKKTVLQILLYTFTLIFVSIIPVFRVTGTFYIHPITSVFIFLAGTVILHYGILLYRNLNKKYARNIMIASVFYITFIQVIYIIDKYFH